MCNSTRLSFLSFEMAFWKILLPALLLLSVQQQVEACGYFRCHHPRLPFINDYQPLHYNARRMPYGRQEFTIWRQKMILAFQFSLASEEEEQQIKEKAFQAYEAAKMIDIDGNQKPSYYVGTVRVVGDGPARNLPSFAFGTFKTQFLGVIQIEGLGGTPWIFMKMPQELVIQGFGAEDTITFGAEELKRFYEPHLMTDKTIAQDQPTGDGESVVEAKKKPTGDGESAIEAKKLHSQRICPVRLLVDQHLLGAFLRKNQDDPKRARADLDQFAYNVQREIVSFYRTQEFGPISGLTFQFEKMIILDEKSDTKFTNIHQDPQTDMQNTIVELMKSPAGSGVCLAGLFTFRNWTLEDGRTSQGQAPLGGMCSLPQIVDGHLHRRNVFVLNFNISGQIAGPFESVHIGKHELGHLIGSPHDSTPDCHPDRYLMGPQINVGRERDMFSACSIENIKTHLSKILELLKGEQDDSLSNCLYDPRED